MSTLESYLSAKNAPNNKIINQVSSSTVDSNQSTKPQITINPPKSNALTKQKSQKYTKSLVDMSAAVSQMEISKKLPDGSSTILQSTNDIGDSQLCMSIDKESDNSFIGDTLNKNNSITDDYFMTYETKIGSNNNLGSTSNMASSNTNISEVIMEGWILRKKQLQSFKRYYMIAKRRQSKAGILCFYKTDHDPLSQPCSTIDLSECTDINYSTSVNSYSSQRYEFKLYLRKHDLHLATNSHETTEKWISAIKQLLPRISKPAYDSLQQEVNSLHISENNLRVENAKLVELVEYYKKTVKTLEDDNKQLEGEVSRLKDELSLFKLENSNQQITNNNMHIKNLNQNMTRNLDKIYNKVTEQEKIEDIFNNGIKNLDEKLEENHQTMNESLNSLKEMLEKRTQKLAKMVVDSQEKIKSTSEEELTKIEINQECLKEIQSELQLFAKDIPNSIASLGNSFEKILKEKLENQMEMMSKEINKMNENQMKLLELCTDTNQKLSNHQDENKKLVENMISQMECCQIENRNIINIRNEDILQKLDDLTENIETTSKTSSTNALNSLANTLRFDDNERFMNDVRIALADIETRISRVKTQEQSNHDIQTQLVKALNDKMHFFQLNLLSVITEKIRKFMVEEQEAKKEDLTSLENRMDELKIIIDTYSNSLKTAVDPSTVEFIDYSNINNIRFSTLNLRDREGSIDSSRIEGIENSLRKVLKEVSKYNSNINMLSRQSSLRCSSMNLTSSLTNSTSNIDTKNTTLELVGSINKSLLKIQDIIGSNETLSEDNDLQEQFKYIKTILETNKNDLEKVFVKRRNIEFLTNQITSLKSERDLLVEEVNKLS